MDPEVERQQKEVCKRFGAVWSPLSSDMKVGIAENVRTGLLPVNGLRHPARAGTTGWYIWAGEKLSTDPSFFKPLHVEHVEEWCRIALKYLGLPPGWRFLVSRGYEDVWYDPAILTEPDADQTQSQ